MMLTETFFFLVLSWNKALALKRAIGLGGEFKRKGANVLLGPVVGPMGRTVRGGRNWEGKRTTPRALCCLLPVSVD
jgi:hypothetical protein